MCLLMWNLLFVSQFSVSKMADANKTLNRSFGAGRVLINRNALYVVLVPGLPGLP